MKAYERFLKYAAYPTMSNGASETVPSTEKQLKLAEALRLELHALGLSDARVDRYGYVYASIPANTEKPVNTIGFIAHMDTSSEASDENIKTRIVDYAGGDIVLMHPKKHTLEALPGILKYYEQAGLRCGTVTECISVNA